MANTAANVSTGKGQIGGYAFIAPTTATMPTDATTALDSSFLGLGYISEDGITNATERDSESIPDMNGNNVATIQTSHSETFKQTFIEALNVNVLKLVYGDSNVTESQGAITIGVDGKEPEEKAFVFELIMLDGKKKRIVIPRGKLTEVGDVVYKASEAIGYETTIEALPDDSGKKHYEYVSA